MGVGRERKADFRMDVEGDLPGSQDVATWIFSRVTGHCLPL